MKIRKAKPGDEHEIIDLIIELAVFEKEPDSVINTPENLAKAILNCIDEKRNQLYVSNIIKAKNYYSWSTFVEKIKTI